MRNSSKKKPKKKRQNMMKRKRQRATLSLPLMTLVRFSLDGTTKARRDGERLPHVLPSNGYLNERKMSCSVAFALHSFSMTSLS